MQLKKKKLLLLLLRVEEKTKKLQIFRSRLKYLIAISSGQDSMCLAVFLRSFQRKLQLEFDIVYCHHAWQQDSFFSILHITKYAAYTETGHFIFLKSSS